MEAKSSNTRTNASSVRWKILKRAILSGPSSNPDNQSEVVIKQISRKATQSFNLIPCHLMKDCSDNNQLHSSKDTVYCYTLPLPNSPTLLLHQRMDGVADLGDFEVCNKYDIDNTGLVCQWPSEEVLAYYCLSHADMFRQKRVMELGSGYGLAGLTVAMASEALEVTVSDGNPQVVGYIQQSINANSCGFGSTEVKPLMLHWGHDKESSISNKFDIIIASDCTFFKEFHLELVQTIKSLLKKEVSSEAILFSPKRGDSLDKFLLIVKDSGLNFHVDEIYDAQVWKRHQGFVNGDDSWPNYEMDHSYPFLVRVTWRTVTGA